MLKTLVLVAVAISFSPITVAGQLETGVEGRVVWENGTPAQGVFISAMAKDEELAVSATNESGFYRITWLSERPVVVLVATLLKRGCCGLEVESASAQSYRGQSEVHFVLPQTGSARIYGKVSPQSAVLRFDMLGAEVHVRPVEFPMAVVRSRFVQKDGSYLLDNLRPGEYFLEAFNGFYAYERRIRLKANENKRQNIRMRRETP